MKETFYKLSHARRRWASLLLIITVGVLLYGFVIVIFSINEYMGKESSGQTNDYSHEKSNTSLAASEEGKTNLSLYQLGNFFARMVLLSVMFFLAQLFIRLYKYNMTSSDYYRTCADAFQLSKELDAAEISNFTSIFTALTGSKVEIEVPDTPPLPGVPAKTKEG